MRKIPYIQDFKAWREEFDFSTTIKVRFSETDMFGHMNNVSAFIYFEQARIEYLHYVGFTLDEQDDLGIPIVADLQCDFLKQIYFNEKITIHVKTNHVGRSSIDIHYMAVNARDEICLTGRGALVYIDKKKHKPIPLPESIIKKLM